MSSAFCYAAVAQDSLPISFNVLQKRFNDKEVIVHIKATIKPNINLYALKKTEQDVLFSTLNFDSSALAKLIGPIEEKGNAVFERDTTLNANVVYFKDSLEWLQKLQLAPNDSFMLKGVVSYLYKEGERYVTGEENLRAYISPQNSATISNAEDIVNSVESKSLLWIFLTAFAAGLLALITPCIYSMIPVTVSFFTKRSQTKADGIRNAILYSLSIIAIFTFLGFLITLIFGPTALNKLATNWIANLFFFAVFLLFGFSFLGAFEIALPSSWSNKADNKAGLSSFWGIFFMALTLVLVSFSCTGPIIGSLLPLITKGGYFGPLIGFFGFSLALALPFALFAFFPSKLNMLGKAGGWLNAIKVTLGFLELALALKFLSNADLAKGWRILDREIFIAFWIVIFFLLGMYLLGKIKFHHDDELPKNDFGVPYLTVTRLMFAIMALVFTVYMIPGLWGAPLKGISAFVPPMGTQDFNASAPDIRKSVTNAVVSGDNVIPAGLPHPEKYYDRMKIYEPEVVTKYGMTTYFDYQEALQVARKLKKPLMLDFTGINCVNCRKMEGQVWSDPEVMKRLKSNFVIASLYVDVYDIDLLPGEQYNSKSGKKIETLGDFNANFQVTKFGANTQPYYFFLDVNEKKLVDEGYGYDPSIKKFIKLLDSVKEKFDTQ